MLRVKSSRKSKLFIILFSVLSAVIFVVFLSARIELIKAVDENAELKRSLSELKTENVRLRIEYESLIDLPQLEEYAKNELGMQKAVYGEKKPLLVETHDKAVIIKDSVKTDADKLVSSIKEYLSDVKCKFN